ncbi:MAG TPA: methyltransferase [Candidatus Binataceae bacterium]
MAGETRSSEHLATASKAHQPSLYRLLRAMCALGLCTEVSRDMFELTPSGDSLRSGAPDSLHHTALFFATQVSEAWNRLADSVRTGQTVYKLTSSVEPFEVFAHDPQTAETFHQAMLEMTRMHAAALAASYDFSKIGELIDLGGGHGELLCAILRKNPTMRGIVYDLPHAGPGAIRTIEEAGLRDRCRIVTGSFLDSVPAGADAFLFKSIIHDWDDERAVKILANCRRAMKQDARLLLIERIMPQRIEVAVQHEAIMMFDLTMMVCPGGRERTEAEFKELLRGAGLKIEKVLPTPTPFSIIEAVSA